MYKHVSGKNWIESFITSFYLLNNCPGSDCTNESSLPSAMVANSLYVIGLLTFAVLLGIVSESVVTGFDNIRNSNSVVHEINHVTVLNWNSDCMVPLIESIAAHRQVRRDKEISKTRKKRRRTQNDQAIVILANKRKEEMEDEIRNYGMERL